MLKNDVSFEKDEIEIHFGKSSVQYLPENWKCKGISIDSRDVNSGNLFIALSGENCDGHNFVNMAFENGASAVVVSNQWFNENFTAFKNKSVIIVKDTLIALGKFANIHRRKFNYPVLAIGGANGKTTTKNICVEVLSQKFKVLGTYKNFNNRIGVPLMLFQMNNEYEIVVLEIGTNEPGEIAILTDISEPTHGLLTNIGREHLEKLIDLDGVEMEETFLFGFLHKTNGVIFLNYDDERLRKYQLILEDEITFGTRKDPKVTVQASINLDDELHPTLNFSVSERFFSVSMLTCGYASALNALAASTVAFHFGLTDKEISRGLTGYRNESGTGYGRMLVEKNKNYTILNDCYNANPESMSVALDNLSTIKGNKKIAVIADMRELGDSTESEHQNILKLAIEKSDIIFLYGNEMKKANEIVQDKKINYIAVKKEIAVILNDIVQSGDIVLIKGSRGLAMEEVVNDLKNKG